MKIPSKDVTGSVQKKNGKWYLVINLYDQNSNRKQKWINTKLEIRGNKKNAEHKSKVLKIIRNKITAREDRNLKLNTRTIDLF